MLYNLLSAAGWSYVLYQTIQSLLSNESGLKYWARIGTVITAVQSTAFLEILHSFFKIVRSPLLTTSLQVSSRLFIIWCYVRPANGINGHWSLYLCFASWAIIEIVRYLYYFISLSVSGETQRINSLLFWLRYTLFMILYPTGITGELFIMYRSWDAFTTANNNTSNSLLMRLIAFHLFTYIPLGPYMILNMFGNRKRAYKKRKIAANPRPLSGLIWPVTDKKKDVRSTTVTNKAIWAASVETVNKDLSNAILNEKNWRFKYPKYVLNNVAMSCQSKENALKIAECGLNKAYELFEFKRDNKVISFKEAMTKGRFNGSYDTHIIKGDKQLNKIELEIPYGGGNNRGKPYYFTKNNNTILKGLSLNEQLTKWVEYGTIEPSAAEAINNVNLNKEKYLDLRDRYFVLLGATSAMGPLYFLLKYGANIIAVDLNRDFIWQKLFAAVKNSAGTLIFPIKQGTKDSVKNLSENELAKISGCDLLNNAPEISNWLSTLLPDKQFNIGNYTYLDGALHVQLSLACDSIINRLCQERPNTSISFLCTPTDDHVITKEAYNESKKNYENNTTVPFWIKLLNTIFSGKLMGKPNYKEMKIVNDIHVINGIVVAQGPNYALAKRIQHWRAILQYLKGHTVSSNIAPSTATKSVVHNKQFEAAYSGMHCFKPMEIMYQETSLAVMGTLLINDLTNDQSVANPKSKLGQSLRNPYELFKYGSFNGGVWRCSHTVNNIGVPSALIFYANKYSMHIMIGFASVLAQISWIATGKVFGFSL